MAFKEPMEDWPTYSKEKPDPNVWILNTTKSDPKKKVEVKGSTSTRVCGSTRLSAKKTSGNNYKNNPHGCKN